MKNFFSFLVIIVLVVMASVTNPSESAHWKQIGPASELVAKGLTGLSKIIGDTDLDVRYVNGVVGSAIVMKENGKSEVLSIGAFGKVWVLDRD